ncbi:MAG: hypothetical protein ACOYJB_07490, partial [Christensenellaceae bacterium]|jgi:hypothetical protein
LQNAAVQKQAPVDDSSNLKNQKVADPDKTIELPDEATLSKMDFYKPQGASSRHIPVTAPSAGVVSAARPKQSEKAAPAQSASMPEAAEKAAEAQKPEPYTGCKTCQERQYQDGSNDSGVSFQTAKHIPASTAAISVASHEGEHVSRETDKAQKEGRVVTNKTVTMQMGSCPECHKLYVAGGTTKITTMASSGGAEAENALDIMDHAGDNIDLSL